MDKRTILAIVLSTLIFIVFLILNSLLSPPKKNQTQPSENVTKTVEAEVVNSVVKAVPEDKPLSETILAPILTKYLRVIFTNRGAVPVSIKINDIEKDPANSSLEDDIEMVYPQDPQAQGLIEGEYPFTLSFGTYKTRPTIDLFYFNVLSETKVEFYRDFEIDGKIVKIKKTFEVIPDSYHLKLTVQLENTERDYLPFDFGGVLYTLGIGPQIGPAFNGNIPDERSDYRRFVILVDKNRNEFNQPWGAKPRLESGIFKWAAITGKYYAIITSTNATIKNVVLDSRELGKPFLRSAMYFERQRQLTQALTDEYTFYVGPKKREVLTAYQDKNYYELAPIVFPFGTIAEILRYPLDFFSKIGNYGVAIILLTILIKILLFPLSRKSFDSMRKMQALNPKLQELREKYKNDPKRLNLEMAELYKREGVSPLGGCLPQLLQLPILFGLYVLFNEHFALKNAVFIPGWINDLSVAESVFHLPFTIPIVNISDIRLLPIIMLITQLIATFFTQTQTSGGDKRMQYLPYILMAVFFFILYNLPSGLVLYWTVQNILTVLQTLIQKFFSERRLRQALVR